MKSCILLIRMERINHFNSVSDRGPFIEIVKIPGGYMLTNKLENTSVSSSGETSLSNILDLRSTFTVFFPSLLVDMIFPINAPPQNGLFIAIKCLAVVDISVDMSEASMDSIKRLVFSDCSTFESIILYVIFPVSSSILSTTPSLMPD